jgi:O-phospho-L-seryl-tRNASec:L-selenocysteinyl-tRNA synthase
MKKEGVLCMISTTSCFAPRGYDLVEDIGKLCKTNEVAHVVNNAYGI